MRRCDASASRPARMRWLGKYAGRGRADVPMLRRAEVGRQATYLFICPRRKSPCIYFEWAGAGERRRSGARVDARCRSGARRIPQRPPLPALAAARGHARRPRFCCREWPRFKRGTVLRAAPSTAAN